MSTGFFFISVSSQLPPVFNTSTVQTESRLIYINSNKNNPPKQLTFASLTVRSIIRRGAKTLHQKKTLVPQTKGTTNTPPHRSFHNILV